MGLLPAQNNTSSRWISVKNYLKNEKQELLLVFALLLIGAALRVSFFWSTDVTWDEAFNIIQGYKVATIFSSQLPLFFAMLGLGVIFCIFVLWKKNFAALAIFGIGAITAVYAFHARISFHPRHPPFYNFLIGTTAFILGIGPEFSAKLISTMSLFGIAIAGYFLARKLIGKKAAIAFFGLAMVSPLSIFYSSTAYNAPLAAFLMYSGITVLLYGIEKKSLLPISGLLFSLAFFTRFTTLLSLFIIMAILYFNRKKISEYKNELTIFFGTITLAIIILLPKIFESFFGFVNWQVAALYVRDIPHYSSHLLFSFAENPIQPSPLFFVKEIIFFFSIIGLIAIIYSIFSAIKHKNYITTSFALLFLAYFVFYSFQKFFQDFNYFLDMEFPALLLVIFAFFKLGEKNAKWIIILIFLVFFLNSVFIISTHNFKGFSEAVKKIPIEKIIFTDFLDPVKYYRGDYLIDPAPDTIIYSNIDFEYAKEDADFAVLTEFYFSRNLRLEKEMVKCFEIKSGEFTAFLVFAKSNQLCNGIRQ